MPSFFAREWIALVILVATPLVGFAQRGGDDADTYPENNYGDARQEAESPRLFRGGLMHQLRSVTESVLGGGEEEKRPTAEPNRNIPKPPPLSSQNQRGTAGGRVPGHQDARGGEPVGTSAAPNRNWAGQFLVPNARNRAQAPAARQPLANERGDDRRVYLGQRSGQRSTTMNPSTMNPSSSGSSSRTGAGDSDALSSQPLEYPEEEASPASEGLALEASDSPSLSEEAIDMENGPAEVVVSHVPDVPYVPRKPLPKRSQKSSPDTSGSGSESKGSQESNSSDASPAKPSLKITEQSEESLTLDSSASQLPSATPADPSATNRSSAKSSPSVPSPSVPSLEGSSLPNSNVPTPAGEPAASLPPSAPTLPSFGSLEPALSEPSLDAPSSLAPSSPPLSSANSSVSTGSSFEAGVPTLALPDASADSEASANATLENSPAAASLAPQGSAGGATSDAPAAAGDLERMHMEIPHVAVKLLGPGDLATGTPTGYELVVQNPDRIALSGLILRMETPPGVEIVQNPKWGGAVELEKVDDGATLLMWNVGQVAPGGSTRLGLDLKATTSRNFAVAIEWTVLPQEGIDELTVKQPDLQVALEGPVDVEKDVPSVYRVRVSNPGNATARNVKVQVSASAQPASQVPIGDLAAGQSEVVEMDLTFEKAGRLEIGAHALADGNLKRNAIVVVNVRQAILGANLSVPKSVLLGGNVFATMELRNTGDGPARKVQAGLMIPPEAEVVNPPSGVTRQGDKLLWEVEIVPPGQVVTVPIELRLPNAGTHGLKFACVTPDGAAATAEAETTVEAFADLKLLVNDPPTPAPIGAPVVYELTVTNRGSRDARNVVILAQFSEGIEPQSATGLNHRVVPGQVLFDAIPTIAAGETIKIKLTAKASVAGMHRFRAEVRCEENDARLVEEESTRYLESASRIASPPSSLIQR